MIDIKKPWAKLLLWASGFVSAICYAIVGGFVFINCEDEELRNENKKVFAVTLLFLALSAFTGVWSALNSIFGASAEMYRVFVIFTSIIAIAKIITFVTFAIVALCSKDTEFDCCCHEPQACNHQDAEQGKEENA